MFIVTYTDYNDSADGHSRLLHIYEHEDDAKFGVEKDMELFVKHYGLNPDSLVVNKCKMEIWRKGEEGQNGCVWDIHSV